jgi:hypothetical protein
MKHLITKLSDHQNLNKAQVELFSIRIQEVEYFGGPGKLEAMLSDHPTFETFDSRVGQLVDKRSAEIHAEEDKQRAIELEKSGKAKFIENTPKPLEKRGPRKNHTASKAEGIREFHQANPGMSYREIATYFATSRSTISRICRGVTFKAKQGN